jgi:hypothetical protein
MARSILWNRFPGSLKVHKIENFFGFDFEIFTICYVKILRFYRKFFWFVPLLGELRFFRVVLRLCVMKKNFEGGKKKFVFFSFMNPLYEPILVFPKFDLFTASGMALSVNLGPKCQNLFPLV